jgi:phage protein D
MATEPAGIDIYAPQFRVSFPEGGGIAEKEFARNVTGIEVEENLDAPAMFRISLHEEFNITSQTYQWLDNKNLRPGLKVELFFGYTQQEKVPQVTGRVKAITPAFQSASVPTMSLEGYDLSQDLQKSEKKFNPENVRYSDVAQELAQLNKLRPDKVEDTKIRYPKVERDKNDKDYDLLKKLAGKIGFEFFVRKDVLYFRKPQDDKEPEFTYEYGKNIANFTPRMATSFLANEVVVVGWDPKTKDKFSGTAGISDIKTGAGFSDMDRFIEQSQGEKVSIKIEGRVLHSNQEAKDLAVAELKRRNAGFIQGTLEIAGDPRLRPGMTVSILKVGDRFSGRYYVTKAKHTNGDGGYRTSLDVRRCI